MEKNSGESGEYVIKLDWSAYLAFGGISAAIFGPFLGAAIYSIVETILHPAPYLETPFYTYLYLATLLIGLGVALWFVWLRKFKIIVKEDSLACYNIKRRIEIPFSDISQMDLNTVTSGYKAGRGSIMVITIYYGDKKFIIGGGLSAIRKVDYTHLISTIKDKNHSVKINTYLDWVSTTNSPV